MIILLEVATAKAAECMCFRWRRMIGMTEPRAVTGMRARGPRLGLCITSENNPMPKGFEKRQFYRKE